MRIIDSYNRFNDLAGSTALQGQRPASSQKGGANVQQEGAPAAAGDAVNVSAHALELSEKAANEADAAKVERLRSAIQDGSFVVDKQAIAARIVDGG